MSQQPQFTPDMVYNLIANNPQGRAFVEQLARVNELQQAARQFAPQIQSFAQNPMQAMQNIGDWAQGMSNQNQMAQATSTPQQQTQQPAANTPQEGGVPMGGMMGMAMDIVGEFRTSIQEMSQTINELKASNAELSEKMNSISNNGEILDKMNDISTGIKDANTAVTKQIDALVKGNKTLSADLNLVKEDIKKLV